MLITPLPGVETPGYYVDHPAGVLIQIHISSSLISGSYSENLPRFLEIKPKKEMKLNTSPLSARREGNKG